MIGPNLDHGDESMDASDEEMDERQLDIFNPPPVEVGDVYRVQDDLDYIRYELKGIKARIVRIQKELNRRKATRGEDG